MLSRSRTGQRPLTPVLALRQPPESGEVTATFLAARAASPGYRSRSRCAARRPVSHLLARVRRRYHYPRSRSAASSCRPRATAAPRTPLLLALASEACLCGLPNSAVSSAALLSVNSKRCVTATPTSRACSRKVKVPMLLAASSSTLIDSARSSQWLATTVCSRRAPARREPARLASGAAGY
jgi:hypothetical protein